MTKILIAILVLIAAIQALPGGTAQAAPPENIPDISMTGLKAGAVPAAEAVARAFQLALQEGDRAAVLAVLAPEATISEDGEVQSREEYASHHLGEDFAFLKTAKVNLVSMVSMRKGDKATVGSESDITPQGKIAIRSREILDLKHDDHAWMIVSVRWQSAPAVSP